MQTKTNSYMQSLSAYLKRKLSMARILGIFSCLLCIGALILICIDAVNQWLPVIAIAYSLATIFASNSFLQDVKIGNPWQRINMICAIFFYVAVLFLIIYGFVAGELTLQF